MKAFDTDCDLVWSQALDGATTSSPALADVIGNGRLQVVEGTDTGSGGSVWVLDGATGATIWEQPVVGRVIGSVVVANLIGPEYAQDVLVPTTAGVEVLDGASGAELTVLSPDLGFQNSPLVTDDPNGDIGITVAGYDGTNQGEITALRDPRVRRCRGRRADVVADVPPRPAAHRRHGSAPPRAAVRRALGRVPRVHAGVHRRWGLRLR